MPADDSIKLLIESLLSEFTTFRNRVDTLVERLATSEATAKNILGRLEEYKSDLDSTERKAAKVEALEARIVSLEGERKTRQEIAKAIVVNIATKVVPWLLAAGLGGYAILGK